MRSSAPYSLLAAAAAAGAVTLAGSRVDTLYLDPHRFGA